MPRVAVVSRGHVIGAGFGQMHNQKVRFDQAESVDLAAERLAHFFLNRPDGGNDGEQSRPLYTLTVNGKPFEGRTSWPDQSKPGVRHRGSDILQQLTAEIAATFGNVDPAVALSAAKDIASQLSHKDFLTADEKAANADRTKRVYQRGINVCIENNSVLVHKTTTYVAARAENTQAESNVGVSAHSEDTDLEDTNFDAERRVVCITDVGVSFSLQRADSFARQAWAKAFGGDKNYVLQAETAFENIDTLDKDEIDELKSSMQTPPNVEQSYWERLCATFANLFSTQGIVFFQTRPSTNKHRTATTRPQLDGIDELSQSAHRLTAYKSGQSWDNGIARYQKHKGDVLRDGVVIDVPARLGNPDIDHAESYAFSKAGEEKGLAHYAKHARRGEFQGELHLGGKIPVSTYRYANLNLLDTCREDYEAVLQDSKGDVRRDIMSSPRDYIILNGRGILADKPGLVLASEAAKAGRHLDEDGELTDGFVSLLNSAGVTIPAGRFDVIELLRDSMFVEVKTRIEATFPNQDMQHRMFVVLSQSLLNASNLLVFGDNGVQLLAAEKNERQYVISTSSDDSETAFVELTHRQARSKRAALGGNVVTGLNREKTKANITSHWSVTPDQLKLLDAEYSLSLA